MLNDNFYQGSGAAIAIRRISEALTGTQYCVASTGDRKPEELSWVPDGKLARFDLKSANPIAVFLELRRFKQWLKQQGCQLVHCHHRRLACLCQLAGISVLYTGHNAFPDSAWFRLLHPKRMTAVTPSVAVNILETTGADVLDVIGNPTHFPEVRPAMQLQNVAKRAVCIARLDSVKGHKHLLAAWKILFDSGAEYCLDLVGDGPLRSELEAQASRDGIDHLIRFHGFSRDVTSIIEQSLFAILVSAVEGQGLVTLEAAAAGRASILTAVTGSIDLLPPNRKLPNGVEFANVQQLAKTLEHWFTNPNEVVQEGKIFFDFLRSSCDTSMVIQRYEQVYRRVLQQPR